MARPVVFISYSHKDEAEKEALVSHLGVLDMAGLIEVWVDDKIGAGSNWEQDIEQAMARAGVAILLITKDFLNSQFILGKEVPTLLDRRRKEGLVVYPVIAKPCIWQAVEWLTEMNVKPKNGLPVWREAGYYADEELTAIAEEVVKIIKKEKSSLKNAFIHNVPVHPDYFIGRTREIELILDQLSHSTRGSSAISGDPRVGKTSLLHYLTTPQACKDWDLSPTWCHFLHLDCQDIIPFSEAKFWQFTLRELNRHLSDDEEILRDRIKRMLEQGDLDIFALNDFFEGVARAGHLVVLMLDEFEGVLENLDRDSPDLLHNLRAFLNRQQERKGLVLLVATRAPLRQLCAGFHFTGSPFDNSFKSITLPPFSEAEVDELLLQYQAALSPYESDLLRQMAGTHPYLVQLSASLIIRARASDIPDEIYTAQIQTEFEQETEGYFSEILDYSSEREKMLLAWLALEKWSQQLPANQISLKGLATLSDQYPQDIKNLVKRGFILEQPDGPTLFSLIFGWWVLRKVVIAKGRVILSDWKPYYETSLSSSQQEALKVLVDKIIRWPIVIKKPDLLARLSAQDEANFSPASGGGPGLSNYRIEEKIGSGGMAEIFKARHLHLDRLVAIKKLHPTFSTDKEFQARFLREARAVAALRHQNIVQIYDFGIQDDSYYMIIEFIEGHDLAKHLKNLQEDEQTLSWEECLRIATYIAAALDYAHQHQMIHRDVKPANILLTDSGGVFLADFGVVRMLGQKELTQVGGVVGTLNYMAPEQLMGQSQDIDYRIDIYALGCVVYEMVTGHLPFEETNDPFARLSASPPPPDQIVSTLPKVASQAILKALAKDPAKRPSSASQYIEDLRQAFGM